MVKASNNHNLLRLKTQAGLLSNLQKN